MSFPLNKPTDLRRGDTIASSSFCEADHASKAKALLSKQLDSWGNGGKEKTTVGFACLILPSK
jgi:hypothetical protein